MGRGCMWGGGVFADVSHERPPHPTPPGNWGGRGQRADRENKSERKKSGARCAYYFFFVMRRGTRGVGGNPSQNEEMASYTEDLHRRSVNQSGLLTSWRPPPQEMNQAGLGGGGSGE